MPGGKGFVDSPGWFEECFGFKEQAYGATQKKFEFADGVLTSTANGAKFHVGRFETPSLSELEAKLAAAGAISGPDGEPLGRLTFKNVTGSAKTLHLEAKNAGAVFQVASQFNCLEMNEPGARPEDGVTRYYCDATQGPACALACPAGTAYRNYLVNDGAGQGGKNQIDCLADVGDLLGNGKEKYWRMKNGYCLPDAQGGIAKVGSRLVADKGLAAKMRGALRVGVHWDTEVKGGAHRVCQVFCSALPVAYDKNVRSGDWAAFASEVLNGTFLATLAAAAVLAQERQSRVTVFLTAVGGGAFGNRSMWIIQAMEAALKAYAEAPLDVRLVHFGSVPKGAYTDLEKGRGPAKAKATAAAATVAATPEAPADAPADEAAEGSGSGGGSEEGGAGAAGDAAETGGAAKSGAAEN